MSHLIKRLWNLTSVVKSHSVPINIRVFLEFENDAFWSSIFHFHSPNCQLDIFISINKGCHVSPLERPVENPKTFISLADYRKVVWFTVTIILTSFKWINTSVLNWAFIVFGISNAIFRYTWVDFYWSFVEFAGTF